MAFTSSLECSVMSPQIWCNCINAGNNASEYYVHVLSLITVMSDHDATVPLNYGQKIKHEIRLKRDIHCCIYSNYIVRLYEPGALLLSTHVNTEDFFGFCSQLCCLDAPPQRVDCVASIVITHKVSFTTTQSCIVSLIIKPGLATLRSPPDALPLSYGRRIE